MFSKIKLPVLNTDNLLEMLTSMNWLQTTDNCSRSYHLNNFLYSKSMYSTIRPWNTILAAKFGPSFSGHINVGPNTIAMFCNCIRFSWLLSCTLKKIYIPQSKNYDQESIWTKYEVYVIEIPGPLSREYRASQDNLAESFSSTVTLTNCAIHVQP